MQNAQTLFPDLALNAPPFSIVATAAEELHTEVYIIGGYVRDLFLKRSSKDIDFVVLGSGIEVAQKVADILGTRNISVYKNFGTALVIYEDFQLEFVGARRESYNRTSRKPMVEDGSIVDDQNRRDFTINALAISLNKANFGQLVDPFNGIADIESKTIRTPLPPLATFSDDPLRMLRAIRFSSQLGFTIEPNTLAAIKENTGRLEIVSKERIADELNKIMLSPKPSVGLRQLSDCGIMELIIPQLEKLKGIESVKGQKHKDNFNHTLEVVDRISLHTDDLWLRWATLLHDIGKPEVKRFDERLGWTFHNHDFIGTKIATTIFRQLKLPLNEHLDFVKKMIGLHHRPISLTEGEVTDSAIRRLLFDAGDDIDKLMMLCEADITSKIKEKVERYQNNFKLVRQKLKDIEEKDKMRNWQPPISGELIMETFNLQPSFAVGQIKLAIREAILDGVISNNFEEAYAYMLKAASAMGIEKKC